MKLLLIPFLVTLIAVSAHARQGDILRGRPEIVDGDTIRLQGKRIRLWGINTPEMGKGGSPARRFLLSYLNSREVVCIDSGHRTYGRWVATCFVIAYHGEHRYPGWTDIARILVRRGLAVPVAKFSGDYYRPKP